MLAWAGPVRADPKPPQTLRIAYLASELNRDGPGLLLRDLLDPSEADILSVLHSVTALAPDILVLSGIDHDAQTHAARALQGAMTAQGLVLPHLFSGPPNAGMRSGLDLNGDGRIEDPQDAQGYGGFPGVGGMVVLSRWPLGPVTELTATLWSDLPWADPPRHPDGRIFPDARSFAAQRLPALVHWHIDVAAPLPLTLLVLAAETPVFDGPEDRNGRRNRDELRLLIDGLEALPADRRAVVIGTLNLDPLDGAGDRRVLRQVLDHARLQDPQPASPDGARRAASDGGINLRHQGAPHTDTADFREDRPSDPGNLRVDYVLPDRALRVTASGLVWPEGSRRAVVWVDLDSAYFR